MCLNAEIVQLPWQLAFPEPDCSKGAVVCRKHEVEVEASWRQGPSPLA